MTWPCFRLHINWKSTWFLYNVFVTLQDLFKLVKAKSTYLPVCNHLKYEIMVPFIWNKSHLKLFQTNLFTWTSQDLLIWGVCVCLRCWRVFCCFPSELKKRYNITALPKLVIVKENGQVITDKGRKQIRDQGLACFRSWLEVAEIFQNFKA